MRRRALLGTALSAALGGCGWAQEEGGGPGEPPGQGNDGSDPDGGSDDDGTDGGDDEGSDDTGGGDEESDDVDTDDLATSEGGEAPIEKEAEALVLRLEDLGNGWEETNAQVTGTCSTFTREEGDRSFSLESCASVYDDEQAAADAYEEDLDRSLKLMNEELDVSPEIGDQATIVREGARQGELGEATLRLLFRDSNAVGRVDYTDQQGLAAAEREEIEPISPEVVVEFGALMHDRWRD